MSALGLDNILIFTPIKSILSVDYAGLKFEEYNLKDPYNDVYREVCNWLEGKKLNSK